MRNYLFIVLLILVSLTGCNTIDRIPSAENQEQTKPVLKEEIKVTNSNNTPIKVPEREPEPNIDSKPLEAGNTSSNINNGGYVATDGVWDYFWLGSTALHNEENTLKLAKMKRDGSEFQILTEDKPMYVNVVGDWIFYIKGRFDDLSYTIDGPIYKIRKDGSGREELYGNNATEMTVVGENIYFITYPEYRLYRMKTDGSELTRLIDDISYYLQYDEGWLYFEIDQKNYIYKLNLATNSKPIKVMEAPEVYVISNDWIYYLSWKEIDGLDRMDGLYRMGLDGTNVLKLFDQSAVNYTVTDDSIYVTGRKMKRNEDDVDNYDYYKMNLDGTEVSKIPLKDIEHHNRSTVFGVFGEYIYYWYNGDEWVDLARVKTDGTSEEILLDRLCTDQTDIFCPSFIEHEWRKELID
jgi:hypothetical protein